MEHCHLENGLTWNQRMHAIDRDELLGQRIGNALVVDSGARDPADGLACFRDTANCFGELFTDDAPILISDRLGHGVQTCALTTNWRASRS